MAAASVRASHGAPLSRLPERLLRFGLALLTVLVASVFVPACGGPRITATLPGVINVVAGENFWGSIAAQIGGTHVSVTNIINDPNVDPHQFESSTAAARAFAAADYVILNGAGYDSWGQKLLDANPVAGRRVLDVANLLGKQQGDNPHFWYDPSYVEEVISQITKDYQTIEPEYSEYFTEQRDIFESDLTQYHDLINSVKLAYAGVKVGATESIFIYMADALGLDLISPPAFMNAVSQGGAPPTAAVAEFQQQIEKKQIAILIYNVQTITVLTSNLRQIASNNGIPTVGISETIVPADLPFQTWQVNQLQAIRSALQASH